MHNIRTQTIDAKIDMLMDSIGELEYMIYAILETSPDAKAYHAKLKESLESMQPKTEKDSKKILPDGVGLFYPKDGPKRNEDTDPQ
jgi:hypothetical protein